MNRSLTCAAMFFVLSACDTTVPANSPESVPPTPPALLAGIEPLSSLNAHYLPGVPGDPVAYPINTQRTFLIFEPTLREQRQPDAGSVDGARTAIMRFTAEDTETGISSLSGEIVFDFECLRALDDGTSHSSDIPGRATLPATFAATEAGPLPVTQQIAIEFSGNRLWREGGCEDSSGSVPFRRGTLQNVRARYSARAINGSAIRASLPTSISGEFRIPVVIRVNLGP